MRWLLLTGLVAGSAFANGRFGASVGLGPAWGHAGNFPPGRAIPLVPTTNYTGAGYGYNYGPVMPVVYPVYWYQQAPQPPPPPQPQVIIEREVIIERPAPAPAPTPPQVIVIEQPAPVAVAPAPPAPAPPPPEPPKPLAPRTPGPDVYSWTDDDGVVHYSTRAPAPAVKAKKLATLAK
ncbi:MAG: DUF4124 domain-containing protein [Myxococcaceae bacterium]|nr:DUF4124 domain-containing protein [Myxococcaceae bacterium]